MLFDTSLDLGSYQYRCDKLCSTFDSKAGAGGGGGFRPAEMSETHALRKKVWQLEVQDARQGQAYSGL